MNDSEIARLEEQLHLTLPLEFVETVRRLAKEVKGLQGMYRTGIRCPLIYGGGCLLSVNLMVWGRSGRKDWPEGFLVCGYDGGGKVKYLVDTREASPHVWQLPEKSKKPEPCTAYPNLPALYEHALRTFREFDAKEKRKKGSKAQVTRPQVPSTPTMLDRPPATAQQADPGVLEEMTSLIQAAGFELAKPQRKHTIERLIGDVLPALPKDLHALYTICDGGQCDRHALRILPLAEAAEIAKSSFRFWPTTGLFPLLQAERFSVNAMSRYGPRWRVTLSLSTLDISTPSWYAACERSFPSWPRIWP